MSEGEGINRTLHAHEGREAGAGSNAVACGTAKKLIPV